MKLLFSHFSPDFTFPSGCKKKTKHVHVSTVAIVDITAFVFINI